jgi:peptidoglycan hydrolase CwlO-like protein
MMKKMLVLICMIALGFLLALTACDNNTEQSAQLESVKAELEQLEAALKNTEDERDNLKVKLAVEQRVHEQLQEKVKELTLTRDQLQKQIEKFTFTCDQSRQQLTEIIETRDKLKKQLVDLSDSRDMLQRRYNELNTSHNQLSKQVQILTESRDEAVAQAQTAQKRIEILVSILDSEKREFLEQQGRLTVTSQAQENTQPPVIEISEYPVAPAELNRPAVIPSQVGGRPVCHSFNTTRPRIMPGQTSILSWQVSNADQIRIEPDVGQVHALGSVAVKPSTATTYTLIAENKAGESKMTCRIEVGDSPTIQKQGAERPAALTGVVEPIAVDNQLDGRPTCHSFSTTRPWIMPGQTSILSWQVSNAERIRIEPDIGPVSALGSVAVKPSSATTYSLIAANQAGERIHTCRIEVGKSLTVGSDVIPPRTSSEQDSATGDRRVLSGRQIPVNDPNATLGKFLGYRARRDESGKFIFIPVFEKKQEE